MIRFIVGRAGSGKSTLVRDEICRVMRETGDSAVVIVPEQQTVLWEARMAKILPESANLRLEITNFTRLANSVFREYGGLSDSPIDEGTRTLLVWRAMAEILPTLKTCGAGTAGGLSRLERCVPRMMKAVDELRSSGITPDEAEAALTELEAEAEAGSASTGLVARLSDAVGVYSAYSALLSERGIDKHDVQSKLARTLREHPYFAGKHVFIDSFFSLTAGEEKILLEIMRQAESVTLTFPCPADGEGGGEVQFAETRDYLRRAKSFAARAGREWETVSLTENRRHKEGSTLASVEEYLFDYSRDLPEACGDGSVRVIKCTDRYDEAECAAAIIDRLVQGGAAYSEIAVTASGMTSREGVIDAVLRRHGIRTFMSESTEVSTSPLVRLITSALRVEDGGWAREDIIKMVKTGLTPLSVGGERAISLEDVFETYTETWNIRGRRNYTSAWSMNPEGYKISMSDASREILSAANEARDLLIPPLEALLSVFDGGVADASEIARRIVYFTEDMGVYASLSRMAQSYSDIGMQDMAKKTLGMHAAVMKILDRMVEGLRGMQLDAGTFAGLFQRVAATFDVGSIPTGIDEVVLGSASGLRVDGVKYMIILGSVEGEFPSAVDTGRDYFDDGDKIALEGVGLTVKSPDTALCTAREYFMYYRAVATPTEALYVLAPCGGEADLSEGARRILSITGAEAESFAAMPLSEVVYTPAAAEYQLARRSNPDEIALLDGLCERAGEDVGLVAERDLAETDKYAAESGRVRMSLSESRLESFARCPFSYSCRYLLKISPAARAEITTPDIGTFMHSVLERFFASLSEDEAASMPLPRERVEELADSIIRDYVRSLRASLGGDANEPDGRLAYLFVRLRRHVLVFLEAIMRELSQSEFVPVAYELPIGLGEGSARPIVFSFTDGDDVVEVVLRGIADRVDVCKKDGVSYVRVVDYKTGAKTFSLDDVYKGIGVQLLIYLFSLWRSGIPGFGGDLTPAGATYFSARPISQSAGGMIDADEARERAIDGISRSGILLSDEAVIAAMDKELSGRYAGVKIGSGGALKPMAGTTLMSAEELGGLQGELERVITEIARRMKRGVADAYPMKIGGRSPCDVCDMRFVCRRTES